MVLKINESDLINDTSYSNWQELVDGFLLHLRDLIADDICQVYNVSSYDALNLVRIRNYDYTSFEVGIIDSKSYSRSHKKVILRILRSEYGSMTKRGQGHPVIKDVIRTYSKYIDILWENYVGGQHEK